jgi:hypothetical protein
MFSAFSVSSFVFRHSLTNLNTVSFWVMISVLQYVDANISQNTLHYFPWKQRQYALRNVPTEVSDYTMIHKTDHTKNAHRREYLVFLDVNPL